jgi:hypothetical protein
MNPIYDFFAALISPVATYFNQRQQIAAAKVEGQIALNKASVDANIERMKTQQVGDIAWDNTALSNSGIKADVMMAVVLAPMVMCFFPGGAAIVREGFTAMKDSLPDYWQQAFYATLAVSYGLKKFTDIIQLKKGV